MRIIDRRDKPEIGADIGSAFRCNASTLRNTGFVVTLLTENLF